MKFAIALLGGASLAFGQTFSSYKNSQGITFWQANFGTRVAASIPNAQFGLALPPASATSLNDEYIGHLAVPIPSSGTWMGIAHASQMPDNLLLLTWLNGNKVMTDFRYATDYLTPAEYTGNAKLTVLSSSVNSTFYELTYRCEHCWTWNQTGQVAGSQLPKAGGNQIVGWAEATTTPTNPSVQTAGIVQHYADGLFGVAVDSARNSAYTSWTALGASPTSVTTTATSSKPTGSVTSSSKPTSSASATSSAAAVAPSCTSGTAASSLGSWDYVVVGGGAGGIPLAAKLTNTGKKVLLIERGNPSSGRQGGQLKPTWLQGTNLTQFDVPGLCNEIYVSSAGITCPDYGVLAGCILGGGTAVNAGLWWKPHPKDFAAFPSGWQSSDMQAAISRVFAKIPFTEVPSSDGQFYQMQAYGVLGNILGRNGWGAVTAGNTPEQKTLNYGHAENMFSHGERGGPMATYLVDAMAKNNFKLILNTMVDRITRTGGTATGVTVEGAYCGNITLNAGGKVILSAGAFGSPKVLFRSGIGPADQLTIVQAAEPGAMIASSQWIDLPVGKSLQDHAQTDIVWTQSSIQNYDFNAAFTNPIASDTQAYLSKRAGILTEAAPVFPIFAWHEVTGPDGIARQIQWQVRNGPSHGISSSNGITQTQYLGRGSTSRGRTTINSALNMVVSTVPYYQDPNDLAAAQTSMSIMLGLMKQDSSINMQYPASGTNVSAFYAQYPVTTGSRSANHWVSSCKMGTDSGLNGGTAVVDPNLKVYGTNNIYVLDASIIPEICSANPSALIVSLAERASDIL
ncbi:hypothetical protein LTR78_010756 [Recurvomyces mirabilis]|uniref:Glucose-methanol-choline oxidoreductase N-terminal domain-containing protein n=1 Tax=Recurvomyces mirabilis TaxID=574656 RepID=A0AAE0TM03_9PEZI|nr:hypothetical protein LTR78_010756 [Recurvomyces mirabilis]KAK5155593.1 hypothetical protein LTS14_005854 [Recurvomyces mirabilis]